MRLKFFTPNDRVFATIAELQAALDGWVAEYSTARPHQSCGRRPPTERFALAEASLAADTSAAAQPPVQVTATEKAPARPGVSRWVNHTYTPRAHVRGPAASFSAAWSLRSRGRRSPPTGSSDA